MRTPEEIRRLRRVNCRGGKELRKDPKKLTSWIWAVNKVKAKDGKAN